MEKKVKTAKMRFNNLINLQLLPSGSWQLDSKRIVWWSFIKGTKLKLQKGKKKRKCSFGDSILLLYSYIHLLLISKWSAKHYFPIVIPLFFTVFLASTTHLSSVFLFQTEECQILKALKTYFLNQLLTMPNGVVHEHTLLCQSSKTTTNKKFQLFHYLSVCPWFFSLA